MLVERRELLLEPSQLRHVVEDDVRLVGVEREVVLVIVLGGIEVLERHHLGDDGTGEDACRVSEALNLFTLAPSLGGVDSLVSLPVLTSHAMIDPESRKKMGVTEQMIRLSVGIENVDDLIADLEQALAAVAARERVQVG